jgi:hypothetical protein
LQPGVIVGTNAEAGNDNLLYTVKVGNRYWVGKETKLFSPQVSVEDVDQQVEEVMRRLEAKTIEEQASFEEEEQRRLEERAAAEEVEEPEAEAATETTTGEREF